MNIHTQPSAEKKALDNIETNEVWETVLQLPAKFKEVLILYAYYQLSVREDCRVVVYIRMDCQIPLVQSEFFVLIAWRLGWTGYG